MIDFWLGTHHSTPRWFSLGVPLFISRRTLTLAAIIVIAIARALLTDRPEREALA